MPYDVMKPARRAPLARPQGLARGGARRVPAAQPQGWRGPQGLARGGGGLARGGGGLARGGGRAP
eukprot:443440-Prymnesium_polylepis.1